MVERKGRKEGRKEGGRGEAKLMGIGIRKTSVQLKKVHISWR